MFLELYYTSSGISFANFVGVPQRYTTFINSSMFCRFLKHSRLLYYPQGSFIFKTPACSPGFYHIHYSRTSMTPACSPGFYRLHNSCIFPQGSTTSKTPGYSFLQGSTTSMTPAYSSKVPQHLRLLHISRRFYNIQDSWIFIPTRFYHLHVC